MMPIWALLDDGKQVAAFRGCNNDILREDCESEALALDLAAKTKKGIALGPGVEIVCLQDD